MESIEGLHLILVPPSTTFLAHNLLSLMIECLSEDEDIICTFCRCGSRLSDLIGGIMRQSG